MRAQGFSLLEVLLVLLLLGILTSIAYPSYQQYVLRTYRAEAITTLMLLANLQEQHLADYGRYSDTLAALGVVSDITESGRYRIKLTLANERLAYQLLLTAEGPQTQDRQCLQFSLNHVGQRNNTLAEPLSCWQ